MVGEMGRNHGKVNSIVFCVVCSGAGGHLGR